MYSHCGSFSHKEAHNKNDFIVNLIATFILYVFTFTGLIGSKNSLSRIDGAVLVLMCITYIIYLIYTVNRSNKKKMK